MRERRLTIFWTVAGDAERRVLDAAVDRHGAEVVQTRPGRLALVVPPALATGAVLALVLDDKEASGAFALGVDEVLRVGEVTDASLERAAARAFARAATRAVPVPSPLGHDEAGFALLHEALGHELASPLFVSAINCELLSTSFPVVLDVTDELTGWAALVAPTEQLRQLVATRLAAPPSGELGKSLAEMRTALEDAAAVLRTIRELTIEGDAEDVGAQLDQLVGLLKSYLLPWADLHLDMHGCVSARLPRSVLTTLVATLIAAHVASIRARALVRGTIVVRALEQDEAVVIEVEERLAEANEGAWSGTLGDDLAAALQRRLAAAGERLRQGGGELMVDVGASSAVLRAVLPTEAPSDVTTALPMSAARRAAAAKRPS